MLLLSTETLPANYEIKTMHSMVQLTRPIEISQKGLIQNFLDRDRNEYKEAIDQLASLAPSDANAVIGIKVTSSTQAFKNGTFLYLTYIGTPVNVQITEQKKN